METKIVDKSKLIILVMTTIFILSISTACTSSQNQNTTDTKAQTDTNIVETETEKDQYGVGETAELNEIQATFNSVTESTGNDITKPAEGNVFLVCEFNITNNSNSDITVSSELSFSAYHNDTAINQSIMGLTVSEKGQLDGTIAAGKKMSGAIVYEVPAEWGKIEINFKPDIVSNKYISFIATK